MPEVPAVPRPAGLIGAVDAAFSAAGALSRVVDGYEPREGQRRMAEAIASVIDESGILLAEAGTGTGKTLAYLIPAILSRQRVLVSTDTKNLQEQIYFKDLPALQEALGVPFTATLMKGRGNYLCLHRWERYQQSPESFERAVFVPVVKAWAAETTTGDRAELRDLPEDLPLWKEINAEAESCLGNECPRWGDCWVTLMRQRAAESDVVIVNHHLLCADASVRQSDYGEVIPSCPTLVIDGPTSWRTWRPSTSALHPAITGSMPWCGMRRCSSRPQAPTPCTGISRASPSARARSSRASPWPGR